jgi:hypothetical protein
MSNALSRAREVVKSGRWHATGGQDRSRQVYWVFEELTATAAHADSNSPTNR